MNQSLPFRIFGGISFLRAALFLFMTERYLASAGVTVTSDTFLLAQGVGVATLSLGFIAWRIPDVAGDAMKPLGQLYGIALAIYVAFLSYNTVVGDVGGATIYIVLVVHIALAAMFFINSKK